MRLRDGRPGAAPARAGPPEVLQVGLLPRAPLGPLDLRVRVAAAGVNPVDAQNRSDPAWARTRTRSSPPTAGGPEPAIDRNLAVHGVLVRPDRSALDVLVRAIDEHGVRPEIDEVIDLEDAARAHERVEAGDVLGKLALACARGSPPGDRGLPTRRRPAARRRSR